MPETCGAASRIVTHMFFDNLFIAQDVFCELGTPDAIKKLYITTVMSHVKENLFAFDTKEWCDGRANRVAQGVYLRKNGETHIFGVLAQSVR